MKIKIGDKVMISDRNPNHLGFGITAYAGWEGIVENIGNCNNISIDCGSRTLHITKTIKLLVEDINGSWVLVKHKVT